MERTYQLVKRDEPPRTSARRRVVPPKPKPGERAPRPYSQDDLDALFATARAFPAFGMASLKGPTTSRITDWPALRLRLMRLKRKLANLHRRNRFPASLMVTEFDPVEVDGRETVCADFHVVFAAPLDDEQQAIFQAWWLRETVLLNNQSRSFHYTDGDGGRQLQDYVAKDMDKRNRPWHWVKFPAPWLPSRLDMKLWFTTGTQRRPAREGRAIRKKEGQRRKSFECEHRKAAHRDLSAGTGCDEREHGVLLITADEVAVHLPGAHAVNTPQLQVLAIAAPARSPFCQVCARRWGREVWPDSCVCSGDVLLGFRAPGVVHCRLTREQPATPQAALLSALRL